MKKLIVSLLFAACGIQAAFAQKGIDKGSMKDARDEARQQQTQMKKQAEANVQSLAQPTPNPFNDTDSFGQNVLFLGSMYAGTVYVYHSCDPQVLLAELGLVLASDDHCVEKPTGGSTGLQGSSFITVFDDVWQVTIPKNTIQNVVYPMLTNGVFWESDGLAPGFGSYNYTPIVTIVSDALNDPAAIDPNTGLPMNGSFTTSLAGSSGKSMPALIGGESENQNYASVAGRGLSRTYFSALGLPNNVINKLFKKEMTLKFGIRVRASGAIDFGQFFYQFRLLGQ
ncbi:MAG: hypothetical protein ACRD43_07215 [Pyrinomonadaceae bacterium]